MVGGLISSPKFLTNQTRERSRCDDGCLDSKTYFDFSIIPEFQPRWTAEVAAMATTSSMFMYSLTIQPPTSITQAILGQFAGSKEQQIVTASGSRLTIHRPDPTQGKISALLSQDIFGVIRSLAAFRLAGSNKGKSAVRIHKYIF